MKKGTALKDELTHWSDHQSSQEGTRYVLKIWSSSCICFVYHNNIRDDVEEKKEDLKKETIRSVRNQSAPFAQVRGLVCVGKMGILLQNIFPCSER